MNEQEFNEWGKNVDNVFYAQIILDELKEKKKLKRKQINLIERRLTELAYEIWEIETAGGSG